MTLHDWITTHAIKVIAFVALASMVLAGADHVFFWDTVQLGAKHGLFYYDSGFSRLLLPEQIDSGHIPAFGMYLALAWTLFGKSLVASHLAMLPFVLGLVWQADRLLGRFVERKWMPLMMALFLCDPTLLSQIILVSPDIPLVFFFLLALNAAWSDNRSFLAMAVAGLFVTSMRGMMVSVAILFIDLYLNIWKAHRMQPGRRILGVAIVYLPAVLIFATFSAYHYIERGWIGFHGDSPWAPAFEPVTASSLLRNIGIFGWRLMDYGRIFLWLLTGALLIGKWQGVSKDQRVKLVALIFVATTFSLLVATGFSNLLAHRYLLPPCLMFALLTIVLLMRCVRRPAIRSALVLSSIIALLSGNFWVYPDNIAQGWDATLGHLPYYQQRAQVLTYLQEQEIPLASVGTAFPLLAAVKFQDLSGDERAFAEKDLARQEYVLYSNISNDFSDAEIDTLQREWELVKEWNSATVDFRLYRRDDVE